MNQEIEQRIKELTLERRALEINHESIVKGNQQANQEFQQAVARNQTRFAQITGAIDELNRMRNGDAPTTEKPTS